MAACPAAAQRCGMTTVISPLASTGRACGPPCSDTRSPWQAWRRARCRIADLDGRVPKPLFLLGGRLPNPRCLAEEPSLSWGFLTHVDFGHFFPAVYLIAWVLARVALYNWLAGLLIVLALHAAAGLAAWRLLRTLLGQPVGDPYPPDLLCALAPRLPDRRLVG